MSTVLYNREKGCCPADGSYIYVCVFDGIKLYIATSRQDETHRLGQPIMTLKKENRMAAASYMYAQVYQLRETSLDRCDESERGSNILMLRASQSNEGDAVAAAKSDGLMTCPTAAVAALAAGGASSSRQLPKSYYKKLGK